MTIAEAREKCKARIPRDVLVLGVLLLVSIAGFSLGYLAGEDAGRAGTTTPETPPSVATPVEGQVVASKSGTKYYLPGCAGADRISDSNKVWFASPNLAAAAGYAPAANCKGL